MTEPQDDSEILNSRTGAGLMMFYDVKERKHELAEGVVSPLRTATRRMLEVADDPENVDLTTLDLDELITRFGNKNSAELTDKSFAAYVSRFRRGRTMYLRWLEKDPNWRGKIRLNTSSNGAAKIGKPTKFAHVAPIETAVPTAPTAPAPPDRAPAADTVQAVVASGDPDQPLFDYPVALVDSNVTAILRLPRTYTTGDAARMAALINALAVPSSSSPSRDA